MLDACQREQYLTDGFVFPLYGLEASAAVKLLIRINNITSQSVAHVPHPWYYKSYLLFSWLDELIRTPALLDAAQSVLGPDIICTSCDLWRKSAGETRHISWHQDASYWKFEPPTILTAWLALTEVNPTNGCMRFLPGSHRAGLRAHTDTFAEDNMLSHGQTVNMDTDEGRAVSVQLEPGQFSLHHCLLAHASGPNASTSERVGLCIRYAPGNLRQSAGPRVSAMPVRGLMCGNLTPEQRPQGDLSDEAVAEHTRLLAPHAAVRYTSF